MEMSKSISLAIIYIIGTTLAHICIASDTNAYRTEFLAAHNAARKEVGVGPLAWDETLEAYAKEYAKTRSADCQPVHSGGPYGENLVLSSTPLSPAATTQYWIDEKRFYNHDTNTCNGGECRHYTQLVWRASTHLGCANATCTNGWTFVCCNYNPAGNFVGDLPY
ncbi:hypothetical protein Ancab_027908 [Ancistrocladus abbreviatus]